MLGSAWKCPKVISTPAFAGVEMTKYSELHQIAIDKKMHPDAGGIA